MKDTVIHVMAELKIWHNLKFCQHNLQSVQTNELQELEVWGSIQEMS